MSRFAMILLCTLAVAMLAARCAPAVADKAQPEPSTVAPEILSLSQGQRIGEGGDSQCPPAPAPCAQIEVTGKVAPGLTPFFGVEPRLSSPWIWIQPPIHSIRSDGTFTGLVHLGESRVGMQESYTVHLFACKDAERFQEGERIRQLPKDCRKSESVDIFRTR